VSKALAQLGITLKKRHFTIYKEQDEVQVKDFEKQLESFTNSQCIYLDECGVKPNIQRDYGWCCSCFIPVYSSN
jgi:hypothetical protein